MKRSCVLLLLALPGCASTTIEFPVGGGQMARYTSTRDTDVGGLRVEIHSPDGASTVLVLDSASGQASTVNREMWMGIAGLLEQVATAARGAAGGAIP